MTATQTERDFIESYAAQRAEAPEQSELFWLSPSDYRQDTDDYCDDCIGVIAALPTLIFYHLRLLIGSPVPPADHQFMDNSGRYYGRCATCDVWDSADATPCWDAARLAIEWNKESIDGGWAGESDGFRFCENCGKSLHVNLTDYAVESELSHWKEYGPPTGGDDWWAFSEVLERFTRDDKHWDEVKTLFSKWGICLTSTPN